VVALETRLSLFCDRVIEAGWLAAAVVVPLFFNVYSARVFEPDKLTLLRAIAFIMAAAWFIKLLTRAQPPRFSLRGFLLSSPLTIPVLLYAALYLLTTATSVTPMVSLWGSYMRLQGLVTNLSYLAIFFLVAYNLRRREQVERLITVMILTSIPISIYGIMQHLKLDPLPWAGDVTFRVASTMGNAIFVAAYLIMVVPLTLTRLVLSLVALWQDRRSYIQPLWLKHLLLGMSYTAILALQLLTILFSKSRGPWVGLGAAVAFLAIIWLMRAHRPRAAVAAASIMGLFLTFAILLNIPGSPLAPLKQSSIYLERLGTVLDMESGTNRVRTLIWFGDGVGKGAVGLIAANPFRTLLGHGPESMYVAYNPYYPPTLAHYEARNASPDRSHNVLLDYLVTMGFAGLFAYLLVLVRSYAMGLRALWGSARLHEQALLVGLLSALTAHVVESITGIAIASTLTYLWLLLGILVAFVMRGWAEEPLVASQPVASPSPGQRPRKRKKGRHYQDVVRPPSPSPWLELFPWAQNLRFYPLAAYVAITLVGSALLVTGSPPRGLLPSTMVIGGYGWLLIGVLLAAFWVPRPAISLVRSTGLAKGLALALGVLALFLSMRLFLGPVIADIYFKQGQGYARTQHYARAMPPYLEAIKWDPQQDYYYLFLGQALLELARTSKEEQPPRTLARVQDLFSIPFPAWQRLGRENLFRAALVALTRAKELAPLNTDHFANLARFYRLWAERAPDPQTRRDRLDRSIDYYRQAVALSPNAAHLRAEWGLAYYLNDMYPEALQRYEEALRLDSIYSVTYGYLGDLYKATGRDDEALAAYKKALETNRSSHSLLPFQKAMLHSALGELYYRKGQLLLALDETLEVLKLAPKDLASHRNLAILYRDLGDKEKALKEARIALSLTPPDQQAPLKELIAELQRASP
jgi:tetratricopeptide (TPR) repeat protein/O-antigen ligase